MDTQSYRKENKGALYEHPCLLYEAKKRKGENEDGNEPLLSTLSPCGYSPCLRERVGWRGETLNINHNHTHTHARTSSETPRQPNCPPETGVTSEAEGVDMTNGKVKAENWTKFTLNIIR